MICPHCKREVSDGNFCSNCSKPLHPKWYQKNTKTSIVIMIASLIFMIICIAYSFHVIDASMGL